MLTSGVTIFSISSVQRETTTATYDLVHILLTARFKHIANGVPSKDKEGRPDDGRGEQIDGKNTLGSSTAIR
jgi:hypothetical protein